MNRPTNYRTKSLMELLKAYSFENERINKEDAEVTKENIVFEVCVRLKDAFDQLDNGAAVEIVYKQFIER